MMNPIEFSTNLFALRRENNLSVEELANLLNVTPEIICEWECAKTSPTMEQMDRLAKIYRVPLPEEAPPVQEPISVDLPEEDPQPEAEIVEEAEEEVLPLPRRGKKSRSKWVDVVVIALLLGIIAAATVFLINPQWFPWLK